MLNLPWATHGHRITDSTGELIARAISDQIAEFIAHAANREFYRASVADTQVQTEKEKTNA